jgi:hypothetical protein
MITTEKIPTLTPVDPAPTRVHLFQHEVTLATLVTGIFALTPPFVAIFSTG